MIEKYEIPIGSICVEQRQIDQNFRVHWHDYFEIEYFFNGSGAYLIDGCSYDIAPHMLFSVSTINFHEITLSNAEYINISFSPDVIAPELLSSLFVGSHSCALRIPEKNVCFVEALLFEMLHTYQENDMLYLTRLLETLLFKLNKFAQTDVQAELSYVQKAVFYLQNNFRSHVTLQHTAELVHIAPSYLSHLFSTEIGISFKSYVLGLRFDYAQKLLKYSPMSIYEICFACGFNNYANFSRAFKSQFGLSPSEYRNTHRNG